MPHPQVALHTVSSIALLALLAAPAAHAENHTVRTSYLNYTFAFTPSNLTIQVGDTVTFQNQGGLQHNVVANDQSFRCANGCDGTGGNGDPSSANWSFVLTFDSPGVVDYFCEVHGGSGMTGRITVEGQPEPDAGEIRFTQAAASPAEGAGSVTLNVQRINGDDGQVSVSYATSDMTATAGLDYAAQSGDLTWPDGDDDTLRQIQVPLFDDGADEDNETFRVVLSSPTGGATLGTPATATVTIVDDDSPPSVCLPDDTTLCLNGGRFQVTVSGRTPTGQPFVGQVVPGVDLPGDTSGLLFFFSADNVEMLVKVLDACELPGFNTYWVFFAATTDLEFTLRVVDTDMGVEKSYTNQAMHPADAITDTSAFATCP